MKIKNTTVIIGALILAGILFNVFDFQSNQTAPNIAFEDIDGQQHTLAEYNKQPALVIFWATDCPGCIREMPELIELYHHYADKGLSMIGVAMAHDTPAQIKAMRADRKIPYTLTWDKDNKIAEAFNNVRVTPTHFLIDKKGKIVMRKIGELNFARLREKLDEMGLSAR